MGYITKSGFVMINSGHINELGERVGAVYALPTDTDKDEVLRLREQAKNLRNVLYESQDREEYLDEKVKKLEAENALLEKTVESYRVMTTELTLRRGKLEATLQKYAPCETCGRDCTKALENPCRITSFGLWKLNPEIVALRSDNNAD